MSIRGIEVMAESAEHVVVRAAAGENWHQFVKRTIEEDVGGFENLALIPGNAGAAPMQNIGAYGVELCDRFVSLQAVNLSSGELVTFVNFNNLTEIFIFCY